MGRATDFSNCYIYNIVDKDKIVHYVGSTSNMNSRRSKHKYNCKNENSKHYHLDIYKYIRDNGGWDNFECVPIRKIVNISNITELRIAERLEMEKFTGLKNMMGSYMSEEEHRENTRNWQKQHPEKNAEYRKKYRQKHPEKVREQIKKWREKKQLEASDQ